MKIVWRILFCFFLFVIFPNCTGSNIIGPDWAEQDRNIKKNERRFSSGNWREREQALDIVSLLNHPGAEQLLVRGLEDSHARVRIAAVKGLALFKNDESFNAVLYTAESDSDSNVRWEALKAIALFRRAEAAPLLIAECRSSDWIFRETSISALLDIEHPGVCKASIPVAIEALDDVNENVRMAAMEHLKIKDLRIYSILVRQLSSGTYYRRPGYLKKILKALSLYRLDKDVRDVALNLLTHPDAGVRVYALRAIKNSDDM